MNITFCCTDTKAEPWLQGLRAALPGATVDVWQPGAPQADHAVVWAPPQQFLDQQQALKGLFNIGAGVDALLKLRLPPGVKVVRLDDAGMSVQMAEYVCHAVIRHFREFDGYEADVKAGKWSYRKPRDRQDFSIGVMGLGVLGERVARALRVFDFPVHGWSRTPKAIEGVFTHSGEVGFETFLSSTRVLVNLLPLTADTKDILNRDTLGRLKPGGYLINVARGAHLVEDDLLALLAALRRKLDGRLAIVSGRSIATLRDFGRLGVAVVSEDHAVTLAGTQFGGAGADTTAASGNHDNAHGLLHC